MSNYNPDPTPQVPIAPSIPSDHYAHVYRRFITHFEPDEYRTGWADESHSGKTDVFLGDWSQLIKIRVTGEEAQAFFEWISTNRWKTFNPGQAKQAIFCNDDGLVVGDGLLLCVGQNDFIFTDGPGTAWATFQFLNGRKKFNATLKNVTEDIGVLQVQGPKSVALMEELTPPEFSVRSIHFNEWRHATILGIEARILRNGISGELGYEAEAAFATPMVDYIPACLGETAELTAYRAFLREVGIDIEEYWSRVKGSYTLDNNNLQLMPSQLGWGWLVSFDHEFIGKKALQESMLRGSQKQVTLVWNEHDCVDVFASLFREVVYEQMELPRAAGGGLVASTVRKGGETVGFATSRCYSSYFKVMLSLAVVNAGCAAQGTEVEVVWGQPSGPQRTIRAVVHPAPFKQDKRKTQLQ